jgi:LDH2 family malate/lactate/ureidoglycolate dehydrogenase
VTRDEALGTLRGLGLREDDVQTLYAHFDDCERRGKLGHGHSRIAWLTTVEFDREAAPELILSEEAYERWDGGEGLGYLVLAAAVRRLAEQPPERVRLIACSRTFPTGSLGYWARLVAAGGLVCALTATSPRRLHHPDGGEPLTGTNPLAIAIPSSDGRPLVADVSMGAITWGDVIAGRAAADELVPFGGEQAHKAFALAVGLELLVGALAGPEPGVLLVVARPEHDPVPALRALAGERRLPGA